jgi:hypothetical protein
MEPTAAMPTAALQVDVAFEPRKSLSNPRFKFCITSNELKEEEKSLDEKRFQVTLVDILDGQEDHELIPVRWEHFRQGFWGGGYMDRQANVAVLNIQFDGVPVQGSPFKIPNDCKPLK